MPSPNTLTEWKACRRLLPPLASSAAYSAYAAWQQEQVVQQQGQAQLAQEQGDQQGQQQRQQAPLQHGANNSSSSRGGARPPPAPQLPDVVPGQVSLEELYRAGEREVRGSRGTARGGGGWRHGGAYLWAKAVRCGSRLHHRSCALVHMLLLLPLLAVAAIAWLLLIHLLPGPHLPTPPP